MGNSTKQAADRPTWSPTAAALMAIALPVQLLCLLVLHYTTPIYEYQAMNELPLGASLEQVTAFKKAHVDYFAINYAYEFALIGFGVGVATGLTTRHRRPINVLVAGLAGSIAGGIAGYLAGLPTGDSLAYSTDPNLVLSTLYLGLLCGCVCGVPAFVVGMLQEGTRTGVKAIIAGAVSGCLAATALAVVFSMLYPFYDLMVFIPNLPTSGKLEGDSSGKLLTQRILWATTFSLVYALVFGIAMQSSNQRSSLGESIDPDNDSMGSPMGEASDQ